MLHPDEYVERVYAGVLGKMIGVYLGRPFEGWTYQKIQAELGEIWYYVHERLQMPLVVADDDLSGTFTFVRALADHGFTRDLTAAQIGQTWLNYIIEERSILWWGGFGNSTEHTAFLRLKAGVAAPESGSSRLNGKIVAEQIGAQIFIDGWALVAPGDPALAAALAHKAASVSHDGEAIYAAQLLAAMEAQAFVEHRVDQLIEKGLSFIPVESIISRLVIDIRNWHSKDDDWRVTRERIEHSYGYDKFGGNCHVVPNHAIIILSLLYAEDNFHRALMIANTSGWDTDCNSGNVGCLMGIKRGLAGLEEGADLRSPVADRLYLSTADGGRCVTDAVRETYALCRAAQQLGQIDAIKEPKEGKRFHFDLPGALQGFVIETAPGLPPMSTLRNVAGHSNTGQRSLAWDFHHLTAQTPARVATPTFIPPEAKGPSHYTLMACPTLYSGQSVQTRLEADPGNSQPVQLTPFVSFYDGQDQLTRHYGPCTSLAPAESYEGAWLIGDLGGSPIARFGFELGCTSCGQGTIYIDYVDWQGAPDTTFCRPAQGGNMWRRAWVNAFDNVGTRWPASFHLSQGRGTGLFIQGSRDWRDYEVQATITPLVAKTFGLAARVQGLSRYYALLLGPDAKLRLVRLLNQAEVLAEKPFEWSWEHPCKIELTVSGSHIAGSVNDEAFLQYHDLAAPLNSGGVAFVCEEGLIMCDALQVRTPGPTALRRAPALQRIISNH